MAVRCWPCQAASLRCKSWGANGFEGCALCAEAVLHGILSRHLILSGESRDEFDALLQLQQVDLTYLELMRVMQITGVASQTGFVST